MDKYTPCQDDYRSHKGIPALAFCGIEISGKKPLSPKYPKEIVTIGDRLRARRIQHKLTQSDLGKILNVTESSITNWENNLSEPEIRYMPSIIQFLRYNPFSFDNKDFSSQIKYVRYSNGLTHKALGKLIGVDASTVGSWEKGEHKPQGDKTKEVTEKIKSLI